MNVSTSVFSGAGAVPGRHQQDRAPLAGRTACSRNGGQS